VAHISSLLERKNRPKVTVYKSAMFVSPGRGGGSEENEIGTGKSCGSPSVGGGTSSIIEKGVRGCGVGGSG